MFREATGLERSRVQGGHTLYELHTTGTQPKAEMKPGLQATIPG
jgi:hypothetical protein